MTGPGSRPSCANVCAEMRRGGGAAGMTLRSPRFLARAG